MALSLIGLPHSFWRGTLAGSRGSGRAGEGKNSDMSEAAEAVVEERGRPVERSASTGKGTESTMVRASLKADRRYEAIEDSS